MSGFESLRRVCEPAIRRVLHVYWRLARGMTLGVRALVVDAAGRIFLVKHSYVSGWHLPGGGVEPGETLLDALIRELREEGNLEPTAPPVLHGMFFNDRVAPGPCGRVRRSLPPIADRCLTARLWRGFFPLDQLPVTRPPRPCAHH
jgi:8-oxo-dGTP pyrophosphatase MutT (NUDIX family)